MQVEFIKPDSLKDPLPNYLKFLKELHKKLGKEALEQRLAVVSLEWALQSGYIFECTDTGFKFTHVSL